MNNTQEKTQHDSDLSLVDLAAVLVRRRWIFYLSFLLIAALGLIFVLMQQEKYEYITLFEGATQADGEYIETPEVTIVTLKNRWIPEVVSVYLKENGARPPFEIQPYNPPSSGLIRIVSEAEPAKADQVMAVHQNLVEMVQKRQQALLEDRAESLKVQIASLDEVIDSFKSSGINESTGTALASAIQKRAELNSDLAALQPSEILVISRQGIEVKGKNTIFVLIITLVFGAGLATFMVFFVEFGSLVKSKLERDEVLHPDSET